MAKKEQVVVEFTDDLDGSKATETVEFSFEGKAYAIDLSKKNATAMRKALEPYAAVGRKISATRTRSGRRASAKLDLPAIRAWAAKQGIEVASRGRIPNSVLERYAASGA